VQQLIFVYVGLGSAAVLPTYFVDEVVNPQEPQTWGNVTRLGMRASTLLSCHGEANSKIRVSFPLLMWADPPSAAGFGNVEVCGLNVAYYTLLCPSPASGIVIKAAYPNFWISGTL
jgi:hypothetical protein